MIMTNNVERDDSAGYSDFLSDLVFFAITIAGCSALGYIVWMAL